MKKISVLSIALITLILVACSSGEGKKQGNAEPTTEVTTAMQIENTQLSANAETISAYGQILNNACVYLNENHADKIKGDVRKEYDATCEKLHNINLQGISTYAQMSDKERDDIFSQLEEIEIVIFDSVADKIGVKAELTEAITTTASKEDNNAKSEVIMPEEEVETTTIEGERITAVD